MKEEYEIQLKEKDRIIKEMQEKMGTISLLHRNQPKIDSPVTFRNTEPKDSVFIKNKSMNTTEILQQNQQKH